MGLGLHIAKSIVTKLKGEISVTNSKNLVNFTIKLQNL